MRTQITCSDEKQAEQLTEALALLPSTWTVWVLPDGLTVLWASSLSPKKQQQVLVHRSVPAAAVETVPF